ncbi:MAG: hypothetical protein S4CHLAM45_03410 [Chlamydiales bacterium]|nr:hypothetical protein [Chlamydiales bacterium]MCH9619197.1 hypothetical protein [Chlamydiales bacterium]MCH9622459.1 hypothetical protein [Chlamydiales bacterium]
MGKWLLFLLLISSQLDAKNCISNYFCRNKVARSRSDNIPQTHITGVDDEYLTGYVQALVDMHYYEFQVRVIVLNGIVYIFNLPRNELIAASIYCFVNDIPCIGRVERVCCSPEEFLCKLESIDQECAQEVGCSSAYQSMCMMPGPGCGVKGVWFPQNTVLFQPLVADPRQVMNAASLRFNDDVVGKHVGAAVFGGDFIFFRWFDVFKWHGDLDLGLQGGIFSVFDLDNPQACMVNSDFFIALMPTYAVNKWSWRFRLWHLSSHLGDEFLLSNPGFDRRNLSDNGVDLFASYQMNPAIRLYLGLGDIIWRDREFYTQPFYFEWGAEIRVFGSRDCFNKLYVQPFLAMHFRAWEEHGFDIDQTYALGVEWSKLQYVGQKFRIFLELHNGYSREGQFARERSNYVAIKGAFGF